MKQSTITTQKLQLAEEAEHVLASTMTKNHKRKDSRHLAKQSTTHTCSNGYRCLFSLPALPERDNSQPIHLPRAGFALTGLRKRGRGACSRYKSH